MKEEKIPELQIYKLKDMVDGNYAFVVANCKERALAIITQETSITCYVVNDRPADLFDKSVEGIWINNILPF